MNTPAAGGEGVYVEHDDVAIREQLAELLFGGGVRDDVTELGSDHRAIADVEVHVRRQELVAATDVRWVG